MTAFYGKVDAKTAAGATEEQRPPRATRRSSDTTWEWQMIQRSPLLKRLLAEAPPHRPTTCSLTSIDGTSNSSRIVRPVQASVERIS